MCGIIAYSGNKDSTLSTLINGLKRMEYRGYDSAGVALFTNNGIEAIKVVGKVSGLEDRINSQKPIITDPICIGHTRWATHGPANEINAHPHSSQDKKLWLVHNGIIENYQEIKKDLAKRGIIFEGDTDTEVVAKLMGELYKGDFRQMVIDTVTRLKGAFSFCVMHQDYPNRVIGVKFSSPLIVGITEDRLIIASDRKSVV